MLAYVRVLEDPENNARPRWIDVDPDSDMVLEAIGTPGLVMAETIEEIRAAIDRIEGTEDPGLRHWEEIRILDSSYLREHDSWSKYRARFKQAHYDLRRLSAPVPEYNTCLSIDRIADWVGQRHMDIRAEFPRAKPLFTDLEWKWLTTSGPRILPVTQDVIAFREDYGITFQYSPSRYKRAKARIAQRLKGLQEKKSPKTMYAGLRNMVVTPLVNNPVFDGAVTLLRAHFDCHIQPWYPGRRDGRRRSIVAVNRPMQTAPSCNQWAVVNSAINAAQKAGYRMSIIAATGIRNNHYLATRGHPQRIKSKADWICGTEALFMMMAMVPKSLQRLRERNEWTVEACDFFHKLYRETMSYQGYDHASVCAPAWNALQAMPTPVDPIYTARRKHEEHLAQYPVVHG